MKWTLKPVSGWTALALSATSAVVSGGAVFVFAKHTLEKKFQEQLKAELADSEIYFKEKYQQMYSTPVFVADEEEPEDGVLLEGVRAATDAADPMPVDLVGQALEAARSYEADTEESSSEPGDDRPPAPVIVNNIFQNIAPEPERVMPSDDVVEALLAGRDPSAGPYIITKEEFYENEPDHEQRKFTYWDQDHPEVLVDDAEEFSPIDDIDRVAGEDNLLHFGYGSGDLEVLYIRNELLDPPMDLHITRSSGRYADEVMGLDDGEPHLKHSAPRKFRIRDE